MPEFEFYPAIKTLWRIWPDILVCRYLWWIISASFSKERMTYHRESGQLAYRFKDGDKRQVLNALEWPHKKAAGCKKHWRPICSHVPDKGVQMVRYYGYYSNVARGKRKKVGADHAVTCILQHDPSAKDSRLNWARLTLYYIPNALCK